MDASHLQSLGLSKKEARIYLACLEIGHGSALRIAQRVQLPKSTVADTLKNLVKKSLVHAYSRKTRTFFTAADPNNLKEKFEKQIMILNGVFPELLALYGNSSQKPTVRFFEGKSGVEILLKEMLKEADELICVSSVEDVFERLAEYFPTFAQERAKKKIPLRLIARKSPKAFERKHDDTKELRITKVVEFSIPFRAIIWVWKNKVAAVTLHEDLMVIAIESKDISDTIKAMFENLWKSSE